MKKILSLIFFLGVYEITFAGNQLGSYYIKRSPRGLLLGDAYVARALDDHILFYNAASLARSDTVSASIINMSFGSNDIIADKDRFDDVADTPRGVVNQYLNYPVHIEAGTVPGIQIFNFAFSLIYDAEVNAIVSNAVNPVLDLNYRYDSGFIFGTGFPIAKSGCGKVAVGGAAKYIKRTGIDDRFSIVGTRVLDALNNHDEAKDVLRDLGAHTDKTWGFDFSTEYSCKKKMSEFTVAASFLDVYTKFDVPEDKTLPEQPMTANFGLGYKFDLGILTTQFSADIAPVNAGLPVSQMFHLGLEVGTPILSVLTGYGPGGFSYGAEVDFLFFRLIGGFYYKTFGPSKDPISQRSAIIYLSLLDFSLDL
jgi:hypothetical protein